MNSFVAPSLRESPRPAARLSVDQLTGDLLCPMCGEPLDILIERTEDGAEPVGQCAQCIAIVEIDL